MKENGDNPLSFICRCVELGRVYWTHHAYLRLIERGLERDTVTSSHRSYEIIERYPKDKYLPSYLVFMIYKRTVYHAVIATDYEARMVRIVTVYQPDPEEWDETLKVRKRP